MDKFFAAVCNIFQVQSWLYKSFTICGIAFIVIWVFWTFLIIAKSSLQTSEAIEELREKAIWTKTNGGDRRSYERLLAWVREPKNAVIKDQLISAIEEIESRYAANIMQSDMDNSESHGFGRFISKPSDPPNKAGFEESTGFSAQNVISHLTMKWWQERARAAAILRNIKTAPDKETINKERLFKNLVKCMEPEENSLFVAKMAFETYKSLTSFNPKSNDVFAFGEAIEDWKKRKEEILKIGF